MIIRPTVDAHQGIDSDDLRHNGPMERSEWARIHVSIKGTSSRGMLLLLLFFTEDMWLQCVSAPSEEVCIGLLSRICSLRRLHTFLPSSLPPFLSLVILSIRSFSLHVQRHALLQRRNICASYEDVSSSLQNESIGTSTAMTNGGTFPLGWTIFFEKISGILYSNVSEI